MRQVDGDDVAGDDGDHRGVPGEAGADDGDVDAVRRGAEEVPAEPERIGGERDDVLALDQEIAEIVREMVGDRDGHQCVNEAPGELPGAAAATDDGDHHADGGEVGAEKEKPEDDEARGANGEAPGLARALEERPQRVLERAPGGRREEAVIENRGEHQQNERRHRDRGRPVPQQSDRVGTQRQLALAAGRAGEAVGTADAFAVAVAAVERAGGADLGARDADLGRGEPRQQPEEQREHLALPEPALAPEKEHPGPGHHRIRDRHRGDIRRHRGGGKDQLDPGEDEQQDHRRPDPERRRIGQAARELAPRRETTIERFGSREGGPPRVDQRPQVADEGRDVRQAHPPDDPHQRGGDVRERLLLAE